MPKTTAAPGRRPFMPQLILVAMLAACSSSSQVAATEPPTSGAQRAVALLDLAQILAKPNHSADAQWKAALVRSYEKAYGPINAAPSTWDAAVRRALTCDAVDDPRCVATSLTALDRLGGMAAVPIQTLAEVSQFHASSPSIERRISDARNRLDAFMTPAPPHPSAASVAAQPLARLETNVVSTATRPDGVGPSSSAARQAINSLDNNFAILLWVGAAGLLVGGAGIAYGVATNAAQRRLALVESERASTIGRLSEETRVAQAQRERAEREAIDARAKLREHEWHVDSRSAQVSPPVTPVAHAPDGHDERGLPEMPHPEPVLAAEPEPAATEQLPDDPRYAPARRLFDALHLAERDVEPFLDMMDELESTPLVKNHVHVIASWHAAVKKARNDVEAAFARLNWPREMPAAPAPATAGEGMRRLIEHASFLSAVLTEQKKEASAVFHWSRQVPAATLQLFWPLSMIQHQQLLKHNPVSVITYEPWIEAPKAPTPQAAGVVTAPKAPEPKAKPQETPTVKQDHESIQREALLAAIGTR